MYRLPALRMRIYCAVSAPLIVYYGVHDDLPLVFIKSVKLLPKKKT